MAGGLEKQTIIITKPKACLQLPWPRCFPKRIVCLNTFRLHSCPDSGHYLCSHLTDKEQEGQETSVDCPRPCHQGQQSQTQVPQPSQASNHVTTPH